MRGISNDTTSDRYTKNCINSLHVPSDQVTKSALKSGHLDSFSSQNHEVMLEEHDHRYKGEEEECPSVTNCSMATSEISNCDSKDVAELDSVLSTSPLPVNGVSVLDERSQMLPELAEVAESGAQLEERLEYFADKMNQDSGGKHKRVLFIDENQVSGLYNSGIVIVIFISIIRRNMMAYFEVYF